MYQSSGGAGDTPYILVQAQAGARATYMSRVEAVVQTDLRLVHSMWPCICALSKEYNVIVRTRLRTRATVTVHAMARIHPFISR